MKTLTRTWVLINFSDANKTPNGENFSCCFCCFCILFFYAVRQYTPIFCGTTPAWMWAKSKVVIMSRNKWVTAAEITNDVWWDTSRKSQNYRECSKLWVKISSLILSRVLNFIIELLMANNNWNWSSYYILSFKCLQIMSLYSCRLRCAPIRCLQKQWGLVRFFASSSFEAWNCDAVLSVSSWICSNEAGFEQQLFTFSVWNTWTD